MGLRDNSRISYGLGHELSVGRDTPKMRLMPRIEDLLPQDHLLLLVCVTLRLRRLPALTTTRLVLVELLTPP
ncbi:hypothetical protein IAD21_00355 [Abditibacteriota bacterium]|nr:hypothetical protein IAD21_00355 [Abditibacteriota bacterium]